MVGEVNNVDTGHGWECKNESETMTKMNQPRDKLYAAQVEPKARSVSVRREKGSEQDSKSVKET